VAHNDHIDIYQTIQYIPLPDAPIVEINRHRKKRMEGASNTLFLSINNVTGKFIEFPGNMTSFSQPIDQPNELSGDLN